MMFGLKPPRWLLGDRKAHMARFNLTVAQGSLHGHRAVTARRKRERANRRAGRRR